MSDAHPPKRDAREIEAITAAYERRLLRYVARIMGNSSCAEDIVQEVFIKFAGSWRGEMYESPQVSAWLYKTAHNETIDFIRRETRRNTLHLQHIKESEIALDSTDNQDRYLSDTTERVSEALSKLNDRDRNLVILKVYENRSYKEISDITGLSVSNVGFILHRAMRKLAEHLKGNQG